MGSIFARRRLRWGSGPIRTQLAALLVCGWLLTLAACTPQAATSTAPPAPYFSATDVSMDSPTDGWAVGRWIMPTSVDDHDPPFRFAMAHDQDGQWRLVPQSVTGDHQYQLVRMLSPTEGWAATRGDIERYDGVRWSVAFPPASQHGRSVIIRDLAFLSPTEGWAVGDRGILQYTRGVWRDVTASLPPPPTNWLPTWPYPGLHSVAIASPTDVWAMGDGGVIWQYDGVRWRIADGPYFPNDIFPTGSAPPPTAASNLADAAFTTHTFGALFATQMLGGAAGWSVGGANPETLIRPEHWGPAVVERYQAGAWQVAHLVQGSINSAPGVPILATVAMTSSQDGWIGGAWVQFGPPVGKGDAGSLPGPKMYTPLLLHYHTGQWTFDSAPAVGAIHRLVMLSADEGWAASDGGLLHDTGGQWRLVSVQPAS